MYISHCTDIDTTFVNLIHFIIAVHQITKCYYKLVISDFYVLQNSYKEREL